MWPFMIICIKEIVLSCDKFVMTRLLCWVDCMVWLRWSIPVAVTRNHMLHVFPSSANTAPHPHPHPNHIPKPTRTENKIIIFSLPQVYFPFSIFHFPFSILHSPFTHFNLNIELYKDISNENNHHVSFFFIKKKIWTFSTKPSSNDKNIKCLFKFYMLRSLIKKSIFYLKNTTKLSIKCGSKK